jgi:predicted transcriptional regulator
MDARGLLKLKSQIEEAKKTTSELKGQQTALMNQLKDDWKCNSIKEAEKLMETMENDIATLNANIEKGLEELEEKYEVQ